MTKFDNLIGTVLTEAGLLGNIANAAASTAGGIGTAMKAAENPASAIGAIKGALDKNKKENEDALGPFGPKNPPKKGQYVKMSDNSDVIGKVVDVKDNGTFSIQLINVSEEVLNQIESGQAIPIELLQKSETQKKSDFIFVQTVNNPTKWQLVTREQAKELANLSNQAQQQANPNQTFTPIVIPENFNKFLIYFNSIIEEKKGAKRTRKSRAKKPATAPPATTPPATPPATAPAPAATPPAATTPPATPPAATTPPATPPATAPAPAATPPPAATPQQPAQVPKKADRLLVINGRGKFTDLALVGPGTSFPNWFPVETTNKKLPPQNNQNQQQAQPQTQQTNTPTSPSTTTQPTTTPSTTPPAQTQQQNP